MAELKLDDAQISSAMNAAILTALGETGKEAIIKEAVAYLAKQDGSYGNRRSPLFDIVHDVARKIATTVLTAKLETDEEFRAQVEALYTDALKRVFSVETREKLVEKMANAMGDAITKDRY
jgi:endo-alpha-1,4-polygalactosaminidase (GH114 family)